jgi:hypothetical protein
MMALSSIYALLTCCVIIYKRHDRKCVRSSAILLTYAPLYCMNLTALSQLSGAAQRGMASSNAQDMAMTAWAFAKLEVIYILLIPVRFLLFAVYCQLSAVCCLLFTVCFPHSSVCYLLSTFSCLPCLLSPPLPPLRSATLP